MISGVAGKICLPRNFCGRGVFRKTEKKLVTGKSGSERLVTSGPQSLAGGGVFGLWLWGIVWPSGTTNSPAAFRWVSEDLQKTARNGRGRLAAVSVEILANPAILGVKQ